MRILGYSKTRDDTQNYINKKLKMLKRSNNIDIHKNIFKLIVHCYINNR